MKKIGFNNGKYIQEQTKAILERVKLFKDKLYLEFGGKILFDYHAARVLPGFDPNVKMRLLLKLKDKINIILCIYAGDIERKKVRADFGITYDVDTVKLINDMRAWGLEISAIVITRYEGQPSAKIFKNKLKRQNIKVYTHNFTKGYPSDINLIVSKDGYGANAYIKTEKPIVVVAGPGPGSGKLATCLSQLYHDYKMGKNSGYAKFETFPIWNLPLKHPINVAYEAATADIKDFNLIDPFHLETYNKKATNYNRDIEIFPVLKRILKKITHNKYENIYNSPTDMGVNKVAFGIVNNTIVSKAAKQELIRRFFRYNCEYVMGLVNKDIVQRTKFLMEDLGLTPEDRTVVKPARRAAQEAEKKGKGNNGIFCGAAIELKNGYIVTGKNSPLMHASSSLILNAIKKLSNIPDNIHLLSPNIIKSIANFKENILGEKTVSLNLDETLMALSISSATNPTAKLAMEKLKELKNCEIHITHIPPSGDEAGLRKLEVNLTSDTNFSTKEIFLN